MKKLASILILLQTFSCSKNIECDCSKEQEQEINQKAYYGYWIAENNSNLSVRFRNFKYFDFKTQNLPMFGVYTTSNTKDDGSIQIDTYYKKSSAYPEYLTFTFYNNTLTDSNGVVYHKQDNEFLIENTTWRCDDGSGDVKQLTFLQDRTVEYHKEITLVPNVWAYCYPYVCIYESITTSMMAQGQTVIIGYINGDTMTLNTSGWRGTYHLVK